MLVLLVLYWWKPIRSNFCFHAEREKKPQTTQHGFAATLFPAVSTGNPKSQLLLFSLCHIWSTLPKDESEDSSVLGTTRLKSPKSALSSDPFLKRVLKPRWTVSFYCWKGLWLIAHWISSVFQHTQIEGKKSETGETFCSMSASKSTERR